MNSLKKKVLYLLALLLSYYILPLFIKDSGSGMVILLIINPLVCIISALFFSIQYGFSALYAALVGLLFLPAVYIFFNSTSLKYVLMYGVIALLSSALGSVIHRQIK